MVLGGHIIYMYPANYPHIVWAVSILLFVSVDYQIVNDIVYPIDVHRGNLCVSEARVSLSTRGWPR
jgi:hypothetical protein